MSMESLRHVRVPSSKFLGTWRVYSLEFTMRRKFLSNGMERGEERALFVSSTQLVINRYFAFSDSR